MSDVEFFEHCVLTGDVRATAYPELIAAYNLGGVMAERRLAPKIRRLTAELAAANHDADRWYELAFYRGAGGGAWLSDVRERRMQQARFERGETIEADWAAQVAAAVRAAAPQPRPANARSRHEHN